MAEITVNKTLTTVRSSVLTSVQFNNSSLPHHLLPFPFNDSLLWGNLAGMTTALNKAENTSTTIAADNYINEIEQFELVGKPCQHFLESLYTLTALLALGGNLMTIVVLTLGRRSSRDLRLFLGNLALADISMALFSIPFTYTNFILGRWIWAPSWCPVVHAMQHVSVFVSIWTLTAIGIERYLNVTFLFRRLMPKTALIIILIWLVAAALGTFVWFRSKAESWRLSSTSNSTSETTLYDCLEAWDSETEEALFTFVLFLAVFALPLGILLFVYGSISYKLWHHSAPGNPHEIRDSAQSKAKIKSIKMLITICVLFAICWGPTHFFQLLRVLWRSAFEWLFVSTNERTAPLSGSLYIGTVITVHWMSMANSFLNPLVYCYMSDNFRADLKGIIRKYFRGTSSSPSSSFCCCRKVNPAQTTASTLVIEQLMVNSGGGGNGLPANGLYQQRNGHHCNNGLHLHFAAHNNMNDWYAMTTVQQPRTNGDLLLQAPLNTPQMMANGKGRNQPIVEYRNGRAVKFKMKSTPSSSGGGGGNNDSGTSTSGGTDNKSGSKRPKKQSKAKYVYERNKWSRRSNASRGSSSGTGSSGGGRSVNFNQPNQHLSNNFLAVGKTTDSVATNR